MNYIYDAVKKLTKKHKTNNPFTLCDFLDISVQPLAMPEGLYGFYTTYLDLPFIFISDALDENEQTVTCAHELGHAILHPTLNTVFLKRSTLFSTTKFEKEADIFASHLLIPDSIINEYFDESISIQQLAAHLGVPQKYIELKLNAMS